MQLMQYCAGYGAVFSWCVCSATIDVMMSGGQRRLRQAIRKMLSLDKSILEQFSFSSVAQETWATRSSCADRRAGDSVALSRTLFLVPATSLA
jgi:hypothetical protein